MDELVDIEIVAMALAVMATWMALCHLRLAAERDELVAEVRRLRAEMLRFWTDGKESDS